MVIYNNVHVDLALILIESARYLNATSNLTSNANNTNTNNTSNNTGNATANKEPSDAEAASSGSLLSAWYIWVAILLAVLLVFGLMAVMWYHSRDPSAGPIKWCCFKPSP